MKANLLYIQEEQLNTNFQEILCRFKNSEIPLFILIQLKLSPTGFEPMIGDIKNIRIKKTLKKVQDWIKKSFLSAKEINVKVVDEASNYSTFEEKLNKYKKLYIYQNISDSQQKNLFVHKSSGKQDIVFVAL